MANRKEKEKQKARRVSAREWAEQQVKGFEPTCIKLPEGVEFVKFTKAGTYKWDFMLYRVGKGNKRASEGMEHFERQYDRHTIPTPDGVRYYTCRLCFKDDDGKTLRCAVCDWLRDNGGSADPKLVKQLRASTRHLWVVNDEPGNKKNPLKVFESNHFNKGLGFGEQLTNHLIAVEAYEDFANPEGGYTLQMTVQEDTFPGGKYYKPVLIVFVPRKYSYPESIIDEAPCLDDCLIDPGYKEVMAILDNEGNSAEVEAKPPRSSSRPSRNGKHQTEEVEEEDKDDEEPEEEEAPPKRKPGEIRVGDKVNTRKWKECDVTKIKDGVVTLDDGEDMHKISLEDLKKEMSTTSSKSRISEPEEEDEDEEEASEDDSDLEDPEDDEDGDDTPPPPKNKKTRK